MAKEVAEQTEVVETYEDRKVAPFKDYLGARLTGAKLVSVPLGEPKDLVLSFDGRPDITVSAWGAYGEDAGLDIEQADS